MTHGHFVAISAFRAVERNLIKTDTELADQKWGDGNFRASPPAYRFVM
jgi:hypothetical protein